MPNKVMTVIANPAIAKLSQGVVENLNQILISGNLTVEKPVWLAPEEACDLHFEGEYTPEIAEQVNLLLANDPYDVVVQPNIRRRKKFLIADMDSTMITIECIDELADFVGMKAHVAAITERAMNGELNFEEALTERVALLKDMNESVLQQAYDERVNYTPGAKNLIQTMRAAGAFCVLVSGGFTFFTERVKDALGFNEQRANTLEVKNGKLTGNVVLPILGKEAKLAHLLHYASDLHVRADEIIAVGDGANDLPMLKAAGTGVAYHAKPNVRKEVNVQINHTDLTSLLYLQGYRKDEIIAA